MIKTLTAHGNSAALIIDKPIMELLGITLKTPLKISTDGKSLVISPIRDAGREAQFQDILQRVNSEHASTLRKLAE